MGGISDMITGSAAKEAGKAARKSGRAYDRLLEISRIIEGIVRGGEAQGLFDADKQIELANRSSFRSEDLQREADAGTARILGYRPGDTRPITQDRGTSDFYQLQRRLQNFEIRQGAFQNRLAAWGATRPGVAEAGSGYGDLARYWMSRAGDPSSFLNAAASWYAAYKGGK